MSEPVQLAGSDAGVARSLVGREGAVPAWREMAPTVVLGAGVVIGVALLVAAVVVRVRARRSLPRAVRSDDGALRVVARAMRLSRGVRAGVERLALAAGVNEPAVLVLSEFAFREAAARAVERVPESRDAIAELARALAYDTGESAGKGEMTRRRVMARA